MSLNGYQSRSYIFLIISILFKCLFVCFFPFIMIKRSLVPYLHQINVTLTRRLQRFRWNIGACLTFITKHSALWIRPCTVWSSVITPVKTAGLSPHTSWICGITEELAALFFSPLLTPSFHNNTNGSAGVRGHRPKGWRQQNRINIHQPDAGCWWLKKTIWSN